MDALRRIAIRGFAIIAILGFLGGLTAAALSDRDERATHASLFAPREADLILTGDTRVHGFIGSTNLAPGDRISGTLRLATSDTAARDVLDLDLRVRLEQASAQNELAHALLLHRLSYGRDDLLTANDGGRDLTGELDTNRDGRVSLHELQRGANDLSPPASNSLGGTGFAIELELDPSLKHLDGPPLSASFHFTLADATSPDPT